jgi:hypothetical protein
MLHLSPVRIAKRLQGTDLENYIIAKVFRGTVHIAAPETQQIGVARMCPHPHAMFHGYGNRVVHDQRIAGMPATGNIGRGDELNHGIIHPQPVGTEALPHIAVEINFFHGVSPFKSEKAVQKYRAADFGGALFGQHQIGKEQGDFRENR